jgi:hypothetical protein
MTRAGTSPCHRHEHLREGCGELVRRAEPHAGGCGVVPRTSAVVLPMTRCGLYGHAIGFEAAGMLVSSHSRRALIISLSFMTSSA